MPLKFADFNADYTACMKGINGFFGVKKTHNLAVWTIGFVVIPAGGSNNDTT